MDMYGSLSTPSDCLHIDDFLDFSNIITTDTRHHHHLSPPQNPPFSQDPNFFFNLPYVPSDEAAELEWLSQFVDDDATLFHDFPPSVSIGSHTASFLANNNNHSNDNDNDNDPKPSSDIPSSSPVAGKSRARREGSVGEDGAVRRCSHCASEKTPQWRTGPLGPKTLCNACGVRFKSGRLVPEYRPAASPTFVLTQHSNSHRKVMELRRQKELLRQQQQQQQQQQEQCYRHTHDFKVC
ncbi:GATA transcription factor 2 [Spatholobus suberectus]|nr:GATA transcription factor 2 [Spatholobus suberectus]